MATIAGIAAGAAGRWPVVRRGHAVECLWTTRAGMGPEPTRAVHMGPEPACAGMGPNPARAARAVRVGPAVSRITGSRLGRGPSRRGSWTKRPGI